MVSDFQYTTLCGDARSFSTADDDVEDVVVVVVAIHLDRLLGRSRLRSRSRERCLRPLLPPASRSPPPPPPPPRSDRSGTPRSRERSRDRLRARFSRSRSFSRRRRTGDGDRPIMRWFLAVWLVSLLLLQPLLLRFSCFSGTASLLSGTLLWCVCAAVLRNKNMQLITKYSLQNDAHKSHRRTNECTFSPV